MSYSIRILIEGEPQGKGRPRAFRAGKGIRMHTPDKTRSYEQAVAHAAHQAMDWSGPIAGPVLLDLSFVFSVPRSWSKVKRAAALAGEILPTKKPDLDNCCKAICDGFNAIVWLDDVQVTDLVARKRYGEHPQVEAIITPLDIRGSS